MTNPLTGDYDVVLELSVDALNRILAALHAENLEPHNLVLYLKGAPRKEVVNPVGLVEAQVSTPTITIPKHPDKSTEITVNQSVMTYFIPDPSSTPMPEFIHAELGTTVEVGLSSMLGGKTFNVNLGSKDVQVSSNPTWSSSGLDQKQKKWINEYVLNFLKKNIKPINITVPEAFQHLKAIDVNFTSTPINQVGSFAQILLSKSRSSPNPKSVSKDLLGAGLGLGLLNAPPNDFAVAVSSNFLTSLIQNQLPPIQPFPISFALNAVLTFLGITIEHQTETVTYDVEDIAVYVALPGNTAVGVGWTGGVGGVGTLGYVEGGPHQILLTITGSASTSNSVLGSQLPSTGFTFQQIVNVSLSPNGEVNLWPALGGLTIGFTSSILEENEGLFSGALVNAVQPIIDGLLTPAKNALSLMLKNQTQAIIQWFNSALKISPVTVTFTGFSLIDGLVVGGVIALPGQGKISRPLPVHADFTQNTIVSLAAGGKSLSSKTQLNAFNSWIPGGTISKYIWSFKKSPNDPKPHVVTEKNQFVTTVGSNIPTEYICLIVEGTQIEDPSGSTIANPVSGGHCVSNPVHRIPIVPTPVGVKGLLPVAVGAQLGGAASKPVIAGYLNPWSSESIVPMVANETVIHFADASMIEIDLSTFHEMLVSEKATAFVVIVLTHEHADKIGSIQLPANYFLGWADDVDGDWHRTFKVSKAPATLIIDRSGVTVWQEHNPTPAKLRAALKANLTHGGVLSTQQNETTLTVGQRAVDFSFKYSDGKEMMLSNFYGHNVLIVFWASRSEPSLEELEYLQANQQILGENLIILAVNDVDGFEKAKDTLKKHHVTFPLIVDHQRQIALHYGINCWPTTIFIDPKGIVRNVSLGTIEKPDLTTKTKQTTTTRKSKRKTTRHKLITPKHIAKTKKRRT